MSDSLLPHESQHIRPPCPSATPGVHSDSRPSSRWCHPAIHSWEQLKPKIKIYHVHGFEDSFLSFSSTSVYCYQPIFLHLHRVCALSRNPMDCSPPGLPVHHQLPEFTEIHVHRVSDAIQPSHPLLSPSPRKTNPWRIVSSQIWEV